MSGNLEKVCIKLFASFCFLVAVHFFSPSTIQISAISFMKVKLFRERSLCLKMRLHIICCTSLSLGVFVNRIRKNTVSSLIFKTFQKMIFSSSGPLCVELQCRRARYWRPNEGTPRFKRKFVIFCRVSLSQQLSAGCGWSWPGPPRAELHCLFSILIHAGDTTGRSVLLPRKCWESSATC